MFRILLLSGLLVSGALSAKDLQGVLDWGRRVELGTLVDGMVSRVHVRPGQTVSRGALLVELDQRALQARLTAAESRFALARQQQDEAARELERSLELFDRTLLSEHEKRQAQILASTADAGLRLAEAELAQLRTEREYSRITAPFDGVIVAVYVQPGQALVNRLQVVPLVTLVDRTRLLAVTEVDGVTAQQLKPGDRLQIGVRQQWLEGELAFVGLEPVNDATGELLYRLEAWFIAPEAMGLRAGESLVVRFDE